MLKIPEEEGHKKMEWQGKGVLVRNKCLDKQNQNVWVGRGKRSAMATI